MKFKPWHYQDIAIEHIIENDEAGLFQDMGLGKTVEVLTAIDRLLNDMYEIEKPLIIAPKKVVEHTWLEEINKWDHLKHLKLSRITGSERERIEALRSKADVYIISRDNTGWLVSYLGGAWPFDMLILDELTSFKNPSSQRFKAVRIIRPKVTRVVGLTGTPVPNGMIDLWAQMFLIDQGKRLGTTFPSFRERYFKIENKYSPHSPYVLIEGDDDRPVDYYKQKILNKISDICISMKKEDYLDMPKRIDRIKLITLPPKIMARYIDFERKLVMEIDDETEITAANATAIGIKLRQFCNGAIYDADKNWHEIHEEKLEALEEDIEAAGGQPLLIFYQFKHDVDRIFKKFRKLKPVLLTTNKDIDAWNRKEIPLMVTHEASAAYGLNMQYGGHLISRYGVSYNLELYEQGTSRLDRQGQAYPVTNSLLLCKDTIDEHSYASLLDKTDEQDGAMNFLKVLYRKYK